MEVLEIKKYPDAILRKTCEVVEAVTAQEQRISEDMLFTMHAFKGVGLAAPQIGLAKQLIVADVGGGVVKLANPKIINSSGSDRMVEGCLSVPERGVEIKRFYEVRVRGLNEKGERVEIEAKGLLARVLQHEIDHLRGKLIIDYLSPWKRLLRR